MPSKIKKHLNFLIFILVIKIISSFKYPKNVELNDAELGEITSVEVSNKEEFDKYVIKNEYVISIFHADWCGHCKRFLPIFDEASRYKIINNKWKFLKIPCSKYEYLCNSFSINGYPTIKVFKESKEIKARAPRELDSLLEFLLKISSNPLIEIENNNVQKFYKDYGTFSPLIEYSSKNTDFISCIKELANKDFLSDYYFALLKKDDEKDGKIIFDFDKNTIVHYWEGNCKDVKTFLNNNLFPLVSNVDVSFMRKMSRYKKLIFMLFYHSSNEIINNFIKKQYKNISKDNREIVFGYVLINKDFDISNYFKINILRESEIQILIYDFDREITYKHPISYDINFNKEEELENSIRELLKNINNLQFTSGSKFKDFLRKIGLADLSNTTKIVLMVIFFLLLIGCLCYLLFCCESEDNYEDYDEVDEKLLRRRIKKEKQEKQESKEKKEKENKENKEVKTKIDKDEIEKIKKD